MKRSLYNIVARRMSFAAAASALIATSLSNRSFADEGGVSFWVPGFMSSLAATPLVPGFSYTNVVYVASVSAGADVAFARQVTRGGITANFNGNLSANLGGHAEPLSLAIPGYTFATPVLGGQANVILGVPYGRNQANVDATLTGALGPIGFTRSGSADDTVSGFGDLIPMFSLRWNQSVHNYMTYLTGNLTTGRYDPTRLANLGIGHNAIDAGGAYTYFDEKAGNEFSVTAGFTYNLENVHTQYQNGVDMHIDWGASHFFTKQLQVGLVGYIYDQLSCDSGSGDRVGCFESRVVGIGPQIGYIIPIDKEWQGYLNVKAYKEFAAAHRADGWNAWVTFAITPAAKH